MKNLGLLALLGLFVVFGSSIGFADDTSVICTEEIAEKKPAPDHQPRQESKTPKKEDLSGALDGITDPIKAKRSIEFNAREIAFESAVNFTVQPLGLASLAQADAAVSFLRIPNYVASAAGEGKACYAAKNSEEHTLCVVGGLKAVAKLGEVDGTVSYGGEYTYKVDSEARHKTPLISSISLGVQTQVGTQNMNDNMIRGGLTVH